MAYIEIRVTGRPKSSGPGSSRPKKVRKVFRNTTEGRAQKSAWAENLDDVEVHYDIRYIVDGRLACETEERKRDADARVAELGVAKQKGRLLDPSKSRLTVDQLIDRWLDFDPAKRGSTIARDRSSQHAHISPAIGSRQVGSLRQDEVQNFVNELSERLAPKTVHRTYGTLRAAFGYAVDAELLERTPCRRIKLPEILKAERPMFNPDDVVAVANSIDDRYRNMVWVGAMLGLRWGETAALRVSSVDLVKRELSVTETVARDEHGRSILGPPKSAAGTRKMSIPDVLAKMLAEQIQGMDSDDPDESLFPAPQGGIWSYANFRRRIWLPTMERAGLVGIGTHDLRRLAVSQLVLNGIDMKTAGDRLGHSDPRLTIEVYAQANSAADVAAADTVGAVFEASITRIGVLDRFSIVPPETQPAGACTPADLHLDGRAARI